MLFLVGCTSSNDNNELDYALQSTATPYLIYERMDIEIPVVTVTMPVYEEMMDYDEAVSNDEVFEAEIFSEVFMVVYGDLNGDGVADRVVVVDYQDEFDSWQYRARHIYVYHGVGDNFERVYANELLIRNTRISDVLWGMEINDGVLIMKMNWERLEGRWWDYHVYEEWHFSYTDSSFSLVFTSYVDLMVFDKQEAMTVDFSQKESYLFSEVTQSDIDRYFREARLDEIRTMMDEVENSRSQITIIHEGDLTGNGIIDRVVVRAYDTAPLEWDIVPNFRSANRNIYIFHGSEDGGFALAHVNEAGLALRGIEGGRFSDALEDVRIRDGGLEIRYLMGSSWSLSQMLRFEYDNGEFVLVVVEEFYWQSTGPHNLTTIVDFLQHTIEIYTYGDRAIEGNERMVLYNGKIPESRYLFSEMSHSYIWKYLGLFYLPGMSSFMFPEHESDWWRSEPVQRDLRISTEEALAEIASRYFPEFERVYTALTEENIRNYYSLVFREIPRFYYRGEEGVLFHSGVGVNSHQITFIPTDSDSWEQWEHFNIEYIN